MTVYTNAHTNLGLEGQPEPPAAEPDGEWQGDSEETSSNAAGNWQAKPGRKGSG